MRALIASNSASEIKPLSSIALAFSKRVTVSSASPVEDEVKCPHLLDQSQCKFFE